MTDDKADLGELIGEPVSLGRHPKRRDQWNIFLGGVGQGFGDGTVLPENVFRIQNVLSSTARDQVKVQIDGRVYRLEPGEVLLLLG